MAERWNFIHAQGKQNIRNKVLRSEHLGIIYVDKDYDMTAIPGLVSGVSHVIWEFFSFAAHLCFQARLRSDPQEWY